MAGALPDLYLDDRGRLLDHRIYTWRALGSGCTLSRDVARLHRGEVDCDRALQARRVSALEFLLLSLVVREHHSIGHSGGVLVGDVVAQRLLPADGRQN